MNDRLKGGLQILLTLAIVLVVLLFSDRIGQFKDFGYIGVFLISLLSSATIFIPAPGWAIVIAMGRVLDARIVGLVAGIGSALGEMTGYTAGRGAVELLDANSHFKRYKDWIRTNDLLAIFILAFIPNPLFDVAGLAAGSLGIAWWRFLLATAVGRILRYVLLAWLGAFSAEYV